MPPVPPVPDSVEALHDDPLSACLLWLAAAHGLALSRDALVGGLPLTAGRLTPSLLARAAERAGLGAALVRQTPARIDAALLPCIVLLAGNRAALLEQIDTAAGRVRLLRPELGMQAEELALADFAAAYSGVAVYCRPLFRLAGAPVAADEP